MSKVWVVNYSGHKIHKAKQYGEIVILTRGKVNVFQGDRLMYELVEQMKDIIEEDYILISGTPILNVFVLTIALTLIGKVNYLLYDARDNEYYIRTLIAEDVSRIIEEVKHGVKVED